MIASEPVSEHLLIGVSVSEPGEDDLISRGLSELHVRHAFVEIARHLLAAGFSLAYGGDFRQEGYTESMLDLVRTYTRRARPGSERVHIYSAWPNWAGLAAEERAEIASIGTLIEIEPPTGAPDQIAARDERSTADRLWACVALTAMRQRMTQDIGVRIVLGGRTSAQQGLLPGIVEEAALAIAAQKPLFVVGGFGGAASLVAAGLRGEHPPELARDYQLTNTPGYGDLWAAAQRHDDARRSDEMLTHLSGMRVGNLRNGMTDDENLELMASDDIDAIIALILRGMASF